MRKSYFVYQCWEKETLYASGLTLDEAKEAQASLDRLIETGVCGDGCAVIGNLESESDFFVARRLGLINESFLSWDDYICTMDDIASDLCLVAEHESMLGSN